MRILCITPRFPYPAIGGDKLRISKVFEYLARRHRLSLLSFVQRAGGIDSPVPPPPIFDKVETIELDARRCKINAAMAYLRGRPAQVGYYSDRRMRDRFRRMIRDESYDAVLGQMIRMAQYLPEFPGLKVLELTDAVSMTYGRAARHLGFPRNLLYRFEAFLTLRYERRAARSVDHCVLVSAADADYLRQRTGLDKFIVSPLAVDTNRIQYQDPPRDSREIVFLGNMRTVANTDAVVYFVHRIFPLIRRWIRDAHFTVVGNAPPKHVRALETAPGVTVTGFVDDPYVYFRRAAIQVAPIRIAGGVQFKILESMSAGTPVITSSIGAEGLEMTPGEHALVAEGPEEFSRAAVQLLSDPDMRIRIARQARQHVVENYQWEDKLRPFDDILSSG